MIPIDYIVQGILLPLFILLANFAEKKNSARIALKIVLYGICILEILSSLLLFLLQGYIELFYYISFHSVIILTVIGVLMGFAGILVLQRRVRKALPFPINSDSPLHTAGLFIMTQALVVILFTVLLVNPLESPSSMYSKSGMIELFLFLLIYSLIAFLAVGFPIRRNFGESMKRLGLHTPSLKQIYIASAFLIFFLLMDWQFTQMMKTYFATAYQAIDEHFTYIYSDISKSVVGVILVGFSAGIGEELIYRGALQPRFGLFLTSFFFASLHMPLYGFTLITLEILLAGLLLGYLRNITNTTCAIFVHSIFDIALFFFY